MRSSSPIALSSSSPPSSWRDSTTSSSHHPRSGTLVALPSVTLALQVSCFSDFIKDRQYGGIRTRDQACLDTTRKRSAARQFRTPSPKPSPSNATVAPFTSYFSGDRYKGTRYASAPDHESPLASPSERILRIRQRKQRTGVLRLPPLDQAPKTNVCSLEGHSPTDQDPLRSRRRRSPSTQQRRSTSYTTTTSSTTDPQARSTSGTCTRKAKSADCTRTQHTRRPSYFREVDRGSFEPRQRNNRMKVLGSAL